MVDDEIVKLSVYIFFFAAGAAFFVCPASVPRLLSFLTAQDTGPMKGMLYDIPGEGLRWCERATEYGLE